MFIEPYTYFSKYDTLPAITGVVLGAYFFYEPFHVGLWTNGSTGVLISP